MWNLIFLTTGLAFITLLLAMFLSKKTIASKENTYFKFLAALNLLGYVIEILLQAFVRTMDINTFLPNLFAKLYLLYMFIWFGIFSVYTFVICLNKDNEEKYNKKIKLTKNLNLLFSIIGSLVIIVLPTEIYYDGTIMYSFGESVEVLKIFYGIYMITWLTILLVNIKKVKEKKYIPIFLVLLLLVINAVVQTIEPSILIATMIGTFICYTMYFTIENPDLKLLRELNYQREQVENSKNISNKVINTISDNLSESINEINNFGHKRINYDNIEEAKKELTEVQKFALKFVTDINSLIELSKTQSEGFTVVNTNYEPSQMLTEIEDLLTTKNKQIKVTLNKDDDVPVVLYGDPVKIKQCLLHLYNGILNVSKVKDIKFNISYLVVGALCRFKVNTELDIKDLMGEYDKGMKDNIIDFEIVDRIAKLLEGKFNITLDNQNKIKLELVFDQKYVDGYYIKDEVKSTTNKKINYIDLSNKKVLIIDDDKTRAHEIMQLLSNYKIESAIAADYSSTKKEASEKVFDLVIVDDIISELDRVKDYLLIDKSNGLLKVMDHIEYDVPRIIMVTPNTKDYESKYIEEGFDEVLTKPVDKYKLDNIIKTFIKDSKEQDM